ncbi:MAG: (d)CMP kinase [Deltaproteobacteria bacterium]
MKRLVVTVDGPAGAGKSTVSRRLAAELDYTYLDTGAIYRTVGLAVEQASRELAERLDAAATPAELRAEERETLGNIARDLAIRFADAGTRVFLLERDVTTQIRTPAAGERASRVSAVPEVRAALLELQRQIGREGGVVVEGRDAGSVVFPAAAAKFFLTATVDCRAGRRAAELRLRGHAVTDEEVTVEIKARDARDAGREASPLISPAGAMEIDSSDLTIEEVVAKLARVVRAQEAS